jgi:GAF domain-containing protein
MTSKEDIYSILYSKLEALLSEEYDIIANMANMSAMIHQAFGFWWTGFYRVADGALILGPFQGPIACTRIPYGKGVCGSSWKRRETIVVPDVEAFPGHIACSSASRSEIVVPIFKDSEIIGVLDIDSTDLNCFDETDKVWLEKIVRLL